MTILTILTTLNIFLKKVCQSFENRNANVVPLQCQNKKTPQPPLGGVLREKLAAPKGKKNSDK